MATKLIEANEKNKSNRLWGDNLNELIKEAISHIKVNKNTFEERFREILPVIGSTNVSKHVLDIKGSLRIYFDPEHVITQEDLVNLDSSEMYCKYAQFYS